MDLDEVTTRILQKRAVISEARSVLVGISGIDGSGKGYVARQIEARLGQHGIAAATINVDGWLHLPEKRFDPAAPAQHFYDSAIRFDEFFAQLVKPLRDHRSVFLEADFTEETASAYRKHTYKFKNVSVILVEGIFLFKRGYRKLFDLAIWIDCSFPTALARALARSQEGLPLAGMITAYETIYFPAQRIHLDRDDPRSSADLVLNNDMYLDKQRPVSLAPSPRQCLCGALTAGI